MNGTHGGLAAREQQACEWISGLQRHHSATAMPLPKKRRASTVERARVCTVSEIPTPPFLVEAVGAGLPLLDFHLMSAFAAGDLVLINPVRITGRDDVARRMLFHEVVHVHQYRAFGLETFIHEYLSGVIASRDYRDLPRNEWPTRQDRYMLNPQVVLSVDEMVRNRA